MPLFLIFIIFNNHSHSTIIHSFILHHSPRPVILYPHRFFAQQEKNLHEVPSHAAPYWATPHLTEPRRTLLSHAAPYWATPHLKLSHAAPLVRTSPTASPFSLVTTFKYTHMKGWPDQILTNNQAPGPNISILDFTASLKNKSKYQGSREIIFL